MSLQNCRVVLVRPKIAGNLGATARVMRNMGLSQLVLVVPEAAPADPQARRLSTHGEAILNQATTVNALSEALADCVLVAGTSARIGGPYRRQSVSPLEAIAPRLIDSLAVGPIAIVFGPESSGLTDEEVTRCHYLIHIRTDPSYPALNLAQSVAITLYELRRLWLARGEPERGQQPAPFAEQERMFQHLRTALEEIHFLFGEKAGPLMHAMRHLIGRAGPTAMEVDVLFGLARQIRWYVRNHSV
jgi:tRNA/rRNA methyltransferase